MLVGAMSAQAAFVASDNIYGIINIPIVPGMNAVGISLLPMPGATNLVQNIMLPEGLDEGTDVTTADDLYIYSGGSYGAGYWYAGNNVWTNNSGSPAAAPGIGLWINSATTTTNLYQIGAMPTAASIAVPATTGNNFIVNPYPAPLDFDGAGATVDWTGVAASGKMSAKTADLIRLWNGIGYDTYYYVQVEGYAAYTGWYNVSDLSRPPSIPAGEGFWFIRRTANVTPVTFQKPASLQ